MEGSQAGIVGLMLCRIHNSARAAFGVSFGVCLKVTVLPGVSMSLDKFTWSWFEFGPLE